MISYIVIIAQPCDTLGHESGSILRNMETTLDQRLAVGVGNQHQTALGDGNDSCGDDAESVVIEFDSHKISLS